MVLQQKIEEERKRLLFKIQKECIDERYAGACLSKCGFWPEEDVQSVLKWLKGTSKKQSVKGTDGDAESGMLDKSTHDKSGNDTVAKHFLLMMGAKGVGKTYFCSAIFARAFLKYPSCRFFYEKDLMGKVRESIGQGEYLKTLKDLIDHDFLIVDDLGSSGMTEWRKEIIFEMIDYRYGSKKPTVFTTNLSKEEMEENFGGRAASRLFAKENTIVDLHNQPDLRQMGY